MGCYTSSCGRAVIIALSWYCQFNVMRWHFELKPFHLLRATTSLEVNFYAVYSKLASPKPISQTFFKGKSVSDVPPRGTGLRPHHLNIAKKKKPGAQRSQTRMVGIRSQCSTTWATATTHLSRWINITCIGFVTFSNNLLLAMPIYAQMTDCPTKTENKLWKTWNI